MSSYLARLNNINGNISLDLSDPLGGTYDLVVNQDVSVGNVDNVELRLLVRLEGGMVNAPNLSGIWTMELTDVLQAAQISGWTIVVPGGDVQQGEALISSGYRCQNCHEERQVGGRTIFGGGIINNENFVIDPIALKNTNILGLAEFIANFMPLAEPGICKGDCAENIAAYIQSLAVEELNGGEAVLLE